MMAAFLKNRQNYKKQGENTVTDGTLTVLTHEFKVHIVNL